MITVDALRRAPAGARTTPSWSAAMLVSGITAAVVLLWSPYIGTRFGEVLAVGAAAVVLALCALRSPVFAVTLLALILFVRLPLGDRLRLPIEPWWIAFALVVGVLVGTYSSIAVASPTVLVYINRRERAKARGTALAKMPREARAK